MLTIQGSSFVNCDRVPRRDFLRVGALTLGGLSLADLLRFESQAKAADTPSRKKAVILLYLAGGPSHIDMYDLKPDAPAEFRGEFRPIKTNVAGLDVGEHLPLHTKAMHQMSVVRSAFHTNAGHGMGSQWMLTGWQPTIEVNDNIYPATGSVVAKVKGPNEPGLPAYVTLPNRTPFSKSAYLGAECNPFTPDSDPNQDGFQVRNLKLPGRVPPERLDRRRNLLTQLDQVRRDIDTKGDMQGIDKFYRDAMEMVTSDKAQQAFNLKAEDPKLRERYGRHDLGQSCLLARRLVEAGVTFVTVQTGGGWDTHGDNFNQLKNNLLPKYDRALTTLVQDIHERGLDKDVLVISYGEFGRTPRINPGAGRDHWPGAMSVIFSGGGLQMGQVIGATSDKAEYPTEKPYTPGSILATMYHTLGIDHKQVFFDHARRPMPILNEGKPIAELV